MSDVNRYIGRRGEVYCDHRIDLLLQDAAAEPTWKYLRHVDDDYSML